MRPPSDESDVNETKQRAAFWRYQASRFLVTNGIQMLSVAVGWQIYEMTGKAISLGYVGLAQFAPVMLLSLAAGHAADRISRRTILAGCNLLFAVCAAVLAVGTQGGWLGPNAIYAVLVGLGLARAFAGPASAALLPQIVSEESFPRAVAMASTSWQAAVIIGPAAGGLVYGAVHDATVVYGIAAVLGLVAFALIGGIQVGPPAGSREQNSMRQVFAGVKYVFRQKIVLGSITLDLFAVLLGGAVALLPVFARDVLHVGPRGFGLLRTAPAVGAALMAIVLTRHPIRRRAGVVMLAGVACFGVSTVVFALSTSFWLSLAALAMGGAADMASVVVRATLIQLATPDAMRGRVSAVERIFVGASNELGEFESGVTAAWWGAVPAALYGGIATCIVVALSLVTFPALRRVDRMDSVKP